MNRIMRLFAPGFAGLAFAASAGAVDIEGSWRGTVTCQESSTTPFIKVCKYKFKRESTTPGAFTEGCPP